MTCAQGSQAGGAPGTGNARTAWRAAGSADAWRVSTALPVRCVKWADTELTANQVTLMAVAACPYHPACTGRKVAMSQLLGGVVRGKKYPEASETSKELQATERETAGMSTCGQPESGPIFHPQTKVQLTALCRSSCCHPDYRKQRWVGCSGVFGLVERQQDLILL